MFASNAYPTFESTGARLCAAVHGEIDHHGAAPLREEIDRALREHRPEVLTLDLADVTFMDSSGLGFVLGRIALCEELGCRVEICRAGERVLRILRMAGIPKLQNVCFTGQEPQKAAR